MRHRNRGHRRDGTARPGRRRGTASNPGSRDGAGRRLPIQPSCQNATAGKGPASAGLCAAKPGPHAGNIVIVTKRRLAVYRRQLLPEISHAGIQFVTVRARKPAEVPRSRSSRVEVPLACLPGHGEPSKTSISIAGNWHGSPSFGPPPRFLREAGSCTVYDSRPSTRAFAALLANHLH